jgi:hypothetical protein
MLFIQILQEVPGFFFQVFITVFHWPLECLANMLSFWLYFLHAV